MTHSSQCLMTAVRTISSFYQLKMQKKEDEKERRTKGVRDPRPTQTNFPGSGAILFDEFMA